ncbi:Bcr/CflA family multidrug efflux MFS transporter [Adhaeribacter soli]|uniref:Bcr/CflA family multidrug efflux MFS transporter n=1 Tax=Adhaeribacter soli TaxID=2607655 RepID=A0A5N1J4E5_9BACT|nr:Bcr/CflA family multidrug efflux MFS transporter [Adhaeribacter soli]KAA9345554.1 Bcr/CflA family multidrug efflux MFS transporter [Adhaeribacter soli]
MNKNETKPTTGLILVLGLLTAFGPMSIDMYLPAFPQIARDFGVSVASVQYTLASFNIGIALGQLIYGPLADQLGRKPNLLAGLAVYVIASIGCMLTNSVESMVALRFLQAIGGCTGMVITRAIVRDKFHGNQSAKVFSTLMLIMGVAPILAPTVGSLVLEAFRWEYIFGLLAAIGLITLLYVAFFLPETLHPEKRNPVALRNSFRTYRQLLKDKQFVGYSLTAGMIQSCMFAYITGSAFVFTQLFHLTGRQYSILFGMNAVGIIGASQLNHKLLLHYSFSQILRRVTYFTLSAAAVLLLMAYTGWFGIYGIAVPLFFTLSSVGLAMPNATAGALEKYAAHAGTASALVGTLQFSCGALAAVAVSVLANNTALPMAGVIAACSLLAFLIFGGLVNREGK